MLDNVFNVLGLDPGNNLGVSILSVNCVTLEIVGIHTFTCVLDKFIDKDNSNIMLEKWLVLEDIVRDLSSNYRPSIVGMEAAFLNLRYPKAIITLGSYTTILEMCLHKYNRYVKVFKYAPKYVKKTVGVGYADKEDMLNYMSNNKEINKHIDLVDRTEHEVDATAIAYTALLEIRKYPYVLYSIGG